MRINYLKILGQFIYQLVFTALGQYTLVKIVQVLDSANPLVEVVSYIPYTAIVSTIINLILRWMVLSITSRTPQLRTKVILAFALVSGFFLNSTLLFFVLEGGISNFFAYLLVFTLPFLAIDLLIYFIRNRGII